MSKMPPNIASSRKNMLARCC